MNNVLLKWMQIEKPCEIPHSTFQTKHWILNEWMNEWLKMEIGNVCSHSSNQRIASYGKINDCCCCCSFRCLCANLIIFEMFLPFDIFAFSIQNSWNGLNAHCSLCNFWFLNLSNKNWKLQINGITPSGSLI